MDSWESVQGRYADTPGEAGIRLRRIHYAPYFMRFGCGVVIEEGCRFAHPDRIVLDDDARLNIGCLVYGSGGVWIGRHARIGPRVFVHSANHDVTVSDSRAYFERGYTYRATVVGDNSLISADVGIMPGAKLGNGCFVAAGARVTGGEYNTGARLAGVPAALMEKEPEIPPAPRECASEIVLLGRDEEEIDRAAHLLSVLRLPQVTVQSIEERIPESAHTVVLLSEENGEGGDTGARNVLRLARGAEFVEDKGTGRATVRAPCRTLSGSCEADVPTRRITSWVGRKPSKIGARESGEFRIAFWLKQRLEKRNDAIPYSELAAWCCALRLLNVVPGRNDGLLESTLSTLNRRRASPRPEKWNQCETVSERDRVLRRLLAETPRDRSRRQKMKRALARLLPMRIPVVSSLRDPELLLWSVLEGDPRVSAVALENLEKWVEAATNTRQLLVCGILAREQGRVDVEARVDERLREAESGSCFPYAGPDTGALCLSPLVLIWRLRDNVPEDLFDERIRCENLKWEVFDQGNIVDEERGRISRSLLQNWIALHSAPEPDGLFLLDTQNYEVGPRNLEYLWIAIFDRIQAGEDRCLVRVRPWPAEYHAALSVRYDVDRPVSATRVRELAAIQREAFNAPCASWYARAGDEKWIDVRPILDRYWQESGDHLSATQEAAKGNGTTHHSAPTSEYWCGNKSISALERMNVSYGEFLAMSFDTPRRAWSSSAGTTEMLVTPLHFPLEGGTNDSGLEYFDQLYGWFGDRLAAGGHVIVASHPDLNQEALLTLATREELRGVWIATVRDVVNRVRRTRGVRAVSLNGMESRGGVALMADTALADVGVDLIRNGIIEKQHTVQLNAGIERIVDTEL